MCFKFPGQAGLIFRNASISACVANLEHDCASGVAEFFEAEQCTSVTAKNGICSSGVQAELLRICQYFAGHKEHKEEGEEELTDGSHGDFSALDASIWKQHLNAASTPSCITCFVQVVAIR